MYRDYFGLKLSPFESTPDPRFFYDSEDHREALASTEYTVRMRKGLVLITGEIGSGKTTVSHALQQRVADSARVAVVRQGLTTGKQLLKQVCRAMGLSVSKDADRSDMADRIETTLLECHDIGQPVVLVIDEAQMHSTAVLHEIRMLSNLETPQAKLVQIVLIGQPELKTRIQTPEMAPLRQRIVLAHHLRPMTRENTGKYIEHRLGVAVAPGSADVQLTPEAMERIFEFTGGVPRLINSVADNCLLVAYVRTLRVIDPDIVDAVTENLVPNPGTPVRAMIDPYAKAA